MRLASLILFAALALAPVLGSALNAQEETLIFLVRHTERADDGPEESRMAMDPMMREDPPLSQAGARRAALLAEMLADVGITHVHSTDYVRTRKTAQPTVEATGVAVALYDASNLDSFAQRLAATPGRHLVVGHSNTTPALVSALGGDPGDPIEPLEYDRLYLVIIKEDGVQTVLLRFGGPFQGS